MKSSSTCMTINICNEIDGTRIRDRIIVRPNRGANRVGFPSRVRQYLTPHGPDVEIVSTEPATSDNDTVSRYKEAIESSL